MGPHSGLGGSLRGAILIHESGSRQGAVRIFSLAPVKIRGFMSGLSYGASDMCTLIQFGHAGRA
jgi:hypothetical protein